jgi:aminoglycoside 6-adenylyltransferase
MLAQILDWANREESIRIMLMVGSRAIAGRSDDLSDFDISIFGSYDGFIENDDWLKRIQPHSICIHCEFPWDSIQIPTRLVIFENGIKVDFAFHPLSLMKRMITTQQLFPDYHAGYRVILDKENITHQLPSATLQAFIIQLPAHKEFVTAINEFWFEAYHVAKYLYRKDLWVAKHREGSMKEWLLKMLEWNAAACSQLALSSNPHGKNLRKWIQDKYYGRLENCFSGWEESSGRKALFDMIELFKEVAGETALHLQYAYDTKPGDQIFIFITKLLSAPG